MNDSDYRELIKRIQSQYFLWRKGTIIGGVVAALVLVGVNIWVVAFTQISQTGIVATSALVEAARERAEDDAGSIAKLRADLERGGVTWETGKLDVVPFSYKEWRVYNAHATEKSVTITFKNTYSEAPALLLSVSDRRVATAGGDAHYSMWFEIAEITPTQAIVIVHRRKAAIWKLDLDYLAIGRS